MNARLTMHVRNALAALGQLSRQPVATAMTVMVIGIALALPASLLVLVQGVQGLAGNWQDVRDFSVYLKPGTTLAAARELAGDLESRAEIETVRIIAAEEALTDLRANPVFGEALAQLENNPLPHTLVVRPREEVTSGQLGAIREEFAQHSAVDLIQIDTQWLSRLSAMIEVARRTVGFAAILLIVAVIVIVGNTIRLDIQNRRQEIEVSKLLGAEDAFVRRPFLYLGFWYGTLGGLVALVILVIGLALLAPPISRLLTLYGSSLDAVPLSPLVILLVFATGVGAGCAGAWTAVARHLAAIEPRI